MRRRMEFKPQVVLLEPEIPQNTGNIARTCAALGCCLHLVGPLGFSLSDRYLRRAGMDYWQMVEVVSHRNIKAFSRLFNRAGSFFSPEKVKEAIMKPITVAPPIFFSAKNPSVCRRI